MRGYTKHLVTTADQKEDGVEASSEFLRIFEPPLEKPETPRSTRMQDEIAAIQHALPELIVLERYERRALSRRLRAIRNYDAYSYVAGAKGGQTGAHLADY